MTAKEIETLTGLSPSASKGFVTLYPAIVLHTVAEQAMDKEYGSLREVLVELPGIGKIEVSRVDGFLRYFFVPLPDFARQLDMAMQKGESPLVKMLESTLIEKINNKYKNLG